MPCGAVSKFLRIGQGKRNVGLTGRATSRTVLVAFVRATYAATDVVLIIVIHAIFIRHDHRRVILEGELYDQGVHMIVHLVRQAVPDNPGHGGYGGVKIEVRVEVLEVTEDA